MRRLNLLRILRIVISLFFFLFLSGAFLDLYSRYGVAFTKLLLYLQFTPSLMQFINVVSFGAMGFAFVLLLTLLFGRVYCSFLCPMGTLQDGIGWLGRHFHRKRLHYRKAPAALQYSILGLIVLVFVSGNILLLGLLEPYSNFGRIISNLIRPIVIFFNNQLATIFQHQNIYFFSPYESKIAGTGAIIFSAAFLLMLLITVFIYGRWFCNSLCPVGGILRLVSRFSLFKIKIDQQSCNSCGTCVMHCKAGCIDSKKKVIEFRRCVGCMDCLKVCPKSGVKYVLHFPIVKKQIPDDSRRAFLKTASAVALAVPALASGSQIISGSKGRNLVNDKKYPVSPPGSIALEYFNFNCTACHLCISLCPTQVLTPATDAYGWKGFLQPVMDYHASFCNFECNLCSQICPNGAIRPLTIEEKKRTQIGIAVFAEKNCVVYNNNTACGACNEHCPTKAVTMIPYKNGLKIPKVNKDICLGCGACEFACPVVPNKAIYVEGSPVHKKALPPDSKATNTKVDYKEEFPF